MGRRNSNRSDDVFAFVAILAIPFFAYLLHSSLKEQAKNANKKGAKRYFIPGKEFKEIQPGEICPAGLEFKMDVSTGKNYARLAR